MSSKRSNQLAHPTPLEETRTRTGDEVLQTPALPLGYLAMMTNGAEDGIQPAALALAGDALPLSHFRCMVPHGIELATRGFQSAATS